MNQLIYDFLSLGSYIFIVFRFMIWLLFDLIFIFFLNFCLCIFNHMFSGTKSIDILGV